MEVRKLRKWPISKSNSSANMYVIKRLTVNSDTLRHYLNFFTNRFLKITVVCIRRHVIFKSGSPLGNEFCKGYPVFMKLGT